MSTSSRKLDDLHWSKRAEIAIADWGAEGPHSRQGDKPRPWAVFARLEAAGISRDAKYGKQLRMKNPHLLRSGIVVIAMAVATAVAAEQKSSVSSADEKFAKSAAIGGMLEVKLGEVAERNASSQAVKNFGSMMVTDHTKLNDELKSLAAKQGITLPTELDSAHQAVLDKLSKLSGAAFDKAYITDMVKDHQKDLVEFKAEAAKTKDPELKTLAEKGASVIAMHLEHAKAAEAKLNK